MTGKSNKLSRRQFLERSFAVTSTTAFAGVLYTWLVEPRWVEFTYHDMPIKNLPDNLIGSTVVQISDMHISTVYNWDYQLSVLKKVTELQPDFVVFTGDFISSKTSEEVDLLYEVFPHVPKGTLGTAAVLGNHDYGHHWQMADVAQEVVNVIESFDIPVLRNEKLNISGLEIVGLDDYWGTNFNPEPVLNSINGQSPAIALCHNPDVADLSIWADFNGWILSGHTHGGQVNPPFLPPPILPVRNKAYVSGTFDLSDGRYLYINRALGNIVSLRFNARPEIAVFTLSQSLL